VSAGPIPLLDESELDLSPTPPEFEALAARELGNAGDSSDGFNGEMLDLVTSLADQPGILTDMDTELNDAATALPSFDVDEESSLALDLAQAQSDGENILNTFEGELAQQVQPPPPPPPPGPVGTGGIGIVPLGGCPPGFHEDSLTGRCEPDTL